MRALLTQMARRVARVVDSLLAQENGARLLCEDGSSIIVE